MPSLLEMLLIGLAVGLVARAVKPRDDRHSWIMMALLGVTGSFLASYVGLAMDWYDEGEAGTWIAPVLGAVTLLSLFGLFKGR
ncbi:GlsB/YeaQ/YmgE family stress response membrane protein [Acidovorax sp.]|uniref:GlsB/YeaQ/YmgE family stress response membrane protein n=1 Tax=Acidovorax sp. TaxID=1872122 RepID=UPI00391CFF9B